MVDFDLKTEDDLCTLFIYRKKLSFYKRLRDQSTVRAYKFVTPAWESPLAISILSPKTRRPLGPSTLTYALGKQMRVRLCNPFESSVCGRGIHVASLSWVEYYGKIWGYPGSPIIALEFKVKDIVAMPNIFLGSTKKDRLTLDSYKIEGKFRVSSATVVEQVGETKGLDYN